MTICLLLVSCGQKPARISPAERKALNSTLSSSHNIDTLSMMQKRMEKEGNMLGSIIAYRLMGKEMRDDSQFDDALRLHSEGLKQAGYPTRWRWCRRSTTSVLTTAAWECSTWRRTIITVLGR